MKMGSSLRLAFGLLGWSVLTACSAMHNADSSRQLMSITIAPATASATNGTAQFTATGTFNTDPRTVTPLAVSWTVSGPGIDPICSTNCQYQITPGSFTAKCGPAGGTDIVSAEAPADPSAPASGPDNSSKMVAASAKMSCP